MKKIRINKDCIIDFINKMEITNKQFCSICHIDNKKFEELLNEDYIDADNVSVRIALILDVPFNVLLK